MQRVLHSILTSRLLFFFFSNLLSFGAVPYVRHVHSYPPLLFLLDYTELCIGSGFERVCLRKACSGVYSYVPVFFFLCFFFSLLRLLLNLREAACQDRVELASRSHDTGTGESDNSQVWTTLSGVGIGAVSERTCIKHTWILPHMQT